MMQFRPFRGSGRDFLSAFSCGKILRRVCLLLLLPVALRAANAPTGLMCDLLEHPEETVITTVTPNFGWIYQPSYRNDAQTGYRIIVASSQALANAGTGDLWDSGMVSKPASINVPYTGGTLSSNANYYWRVQTMDSAGQTSSFSDIQHFLTGSSTNLWADRYPLRFVAAAPVLVTNTAPGRWFIDFGQDAFSYATVHANGSFGGTAVQARFGEIASGTAVNTAPSGTVRYGTSTFTLQNGDVVYEVRPPANGGQAISPPAAYGVVLPFRYFELTNFPGALTAADVTQWRLVYEFNTNAASFSSSSPNLNQIWTLCRNSMQWLSFDGIYVDGDRERKPYEADAYIEQLSSYAVDREFTLPRYTFQYLLTHPTWPTEWKSHMLLIAWADYLQTGDTNLLSRNYDALKYDTFTWAATGNRLMKGFPGFAQTTNSDIVDWPTGDRDGFAGISGSGYRNWTNSVVNAFYYRGLQIMADIATVIGRTSDAADYATDAAQVYTAYNATFWNNGSQSYVDGVGTTHSSAHANFFPLAFGLVPADRQTAVVNYLHSRMAALQGMPPSVYGAQYLLEALFESDDADTALGLMTTNGPRSWMNMINLGSTLTTEAWSFADKPNEDWNHAWGAAAGNLITRYVLGLRPLAAGYGQVLIQPQLGGTLTWVQGTVPTIRGPVSIQASNAPGQFQLLLNIPGNVTATVILPTLGAANPVALVDGEVVSGTVSNDWLTVTNISSGQHAVWLSTNDAPSTAALYNNWAAGWFGTNVSNVSLAGMDADPDGDGMSNFKEFVAGTDPLDAGDWFHILNTEYSPAGPVMNVMVTGNAGRHYTLQHSLSLNPASWTTADTQTATIDNQTIALHDASLTGSTQAFLRVIVTYP
jgi:hypothetical protein